MLIRLAVIAHVRRDALRSVLVDGGRLVVQVDVWPRGLQDALGFGVRYIHGLKGGVLGGRRRSEGWWWQRWWWRCWRRQQDFLYGGGQHGGSQEGVVVGVVDRVSVVGVHGSSYFALQRSHGWDRRSEAIGGVSRDRLGAQVQQGSPRTLPWLFQTALVAAGHRGGAVAAGSAFCGKTRSRLGWFFRCSCTPNLLGRDQKLEAIPSLGISVTYLVLSTSEMPSAGSVTPANTSPFPSIPSKLLRATIFGTFILCSPRQFCAAFVSGCASAIRSQFPVTCKEPPASSRSETECNPP